MFVFFYNLVQVLGALLLFLRRGRSKRFCAYLGWQLPKPPPKQGLSFLFYAVSVGEVKALGSLFSLLKGQYKDASFHVATRTETGLGEAKRSLQGADSYFLLPFDFSWAMKRLVSRLALDVLIIAEGDVWCQLLSYTKKRGGVLLLVSAKMSERSCRRLARIPFLAKRLYSPFSLICAQNQVAAERFRRLGVSSVVVTGNLKWQTNHPPLSEEEKGVWRKKLGLQEKERVLVIGSTHDPEEEEIVMRLLSLPYTVKLILVPRHPERFLEVEKKLKERGVKLGVFSSSLTGEERVILVDKMGVLTALYELADLAVLGGSFFSHLKGHNILEPIQAGIPVLFGPYMEDQKELVELVLSFQAGKQVDLGSLYQTVEELFSNQALYSLLKKGGQELWSGRENPLQKTCLSIRQAITLRNR